MSTIRTIILLAAIVLAISACAGTGTHTQLIQQGVKPTIGVVTRLSDDMVIYFVGVTAFQHTQHQHEFKNDYVGKIQAHARQLLRNGNLVNHSEIPPGDAKALAIQVLGEELYESLGTPFQGAPVTEFNFDGGMAGRTAAWAKNSGLDYILFILPVARGMFGYSGRGYVEAGGLLVDDVVDPRSYVYGSFRAILVDVKNAAVSGSSRFAVFQQIENLTHDKLDEAVLAEIRQKRDSIQTRLDNAEFVSPSDQAKLKRDLDVWIAIEAAYRGKDYDKLDTAQLAMLEEKILFVSKLAIEQILANLQIIPGEPTRRLDKLIPSTEPVMFPVNY